MRYLAIVEKRKNSWAAWVPDLRNCVAVAETEEEVKRLIQEAIEIHLEDLTQKRVSRFSLQYHEANTSKFWRHRQKRNTATSYVDTFVR